MDNKDKNVNLKLLTIEIEKDWKQLKQQAQYSNIDNDINDVLTIFEKYDSNDRNALLNIRMYKYNILKFSEIIENIVNTFNTAIENKWEIGATLNRFFKDKFDSKLTSSSHDLWILYILFDKILNCQAAKTVQLLYEFEIIKLPNNNNNNKQNKNKNKKQKSRARLAKEAIILNYDFLFVVNGIIEILLNKINLNDIIKTSNEAMVIVYNNIFKCIEYLIKDLFHKIRLPVTLNGSVARNGELSQNILSLILSFIKQFENTIDHEQSQEKKSNVENEFAIDCDLVGLKKQIKKLQDQIIVGKNDKIKSQATTTTTTIGSQVSTATNVSNIFNIKCKQGIKARKSIEITGFESERKENDDSRRYRWASISDMDDKVLQAPAGYELIGSLGAGGCASVDAVFNKNNGLIYASKKMSKWIDTAAKKRVQSTYHTNMFNRESTFYQTFKMDKCKYLVNMHEKCQDDENYYIVLDYYKHGDLYNYLSNNKTTFDEQWLKKLIAMIVCGINESHSCDIVNLDIKDENIFVTNDGKIVVADFGVARKISKLKRTKLNVRVGTLFASSPEMLNDNKIGSHCDWWGLGVLMFVICFNSFPFEKLNQLSFNQVRDFQGLFSQKNYFNHDYLKNIQTNATSSRQRLTERLSDDGLDFLKQLLSFDYKNRLGTNRNKVMDHKWFHDFDWTKVQNKQMSLFE